MKTTVTTYHCTLCSAEICTYGFNSDATITEGAGIVFTGTGSDRKANEVPLNVCDVNHWCARCMAQNGKVQS